MRIKLLFITLVTSAITSTGIAQVNSSYMESYNFNRGIELVREGKDGEALEFFRKEIKDNPKNGYAYSWIGSIHYRHKEFGQALNALTTSIKYLSKKDEEFMPFSYMVRGKVYMELGDTIKAFEDLNKGLELFPNDKELLEERAQLHYELKDYVSSDADYKKMINIVPGDEMGYMGLGRNAKAQNLYDKAIEMFDKVILMAPDYTSGYAFRAECYLRQGKFEKAIEDDIKALSLEQDDKAFYLLMELADSAKSTLVSRMKIQILKEKKNLIWYFFLGQIYEHCKEYYTAIDYYTQGIAIDVRPSLESSIADCYLSIGDFDNALIHIDKAYNIDPEKEIYLVQKAQILLYNKKEQDALEIIDKILESNPDYINGYRIRAAIKERLGNIEGAIEDLGISILLEPEDMFNVSKRADFYSKNGQTELAKNDYRKVLENDSVMSETSVAMYAYHGLGRIEKAKEFMQEMLIKYPDENGNYYDAACLYGRMGEIEEALKYLRLALEKGYDDFNHISVDYDMDVFRNMPEFQNLIEEYKPKKRISSEQNLTTEEKAEISVNIPFTKESGVCKVVCKINDLPLHFIFDTGASTVSISNVEATFMYKNGYIKREDVIGKQNFVDANGDVSEGTIINLRRIDFGGFVLDNVRASVVRNQKAPLLLGQSVLGRLGKIEIDNGQQIIKITNGK